MPFDRISPQQMFWMRVATAATFLALGLALALLAGVALFADSPAVTRFGEPTGALFLLVAMVFGVFLINAGMMLAELVTKAPLRMAINVPFVAANFQVALAVGLVTMVFTVQHLQRAGEASAAVLSVQTLTLVGFVLNLTFVMMTKAHWNFTENTGKELP